MKKFVGSIMALTACGAFASSSGSASAPAPAAAQADPWELHQTAESCYLSRSIGKMDVLIQSFGSASPYHVIIRGPGLPLMPQRAAVARIAFGGLDAASDTMVFVGKTGAMPTLVFLANGPPRGRIHVMGSLYYGKRTDAKVGASIDPAGQDLSVEISGAEPFSLPIGAMEGEYKRLEECAHSLDAKWGLAASGGAKPVDGPTLHDPNEVSWHMKYPEDLLLNRVSGLAELRATVDSHGRVSDCVVQISIWASRFGDAACTHLREVAHFDPAHDAEGNPVNAVFRTASLYIIWDW